MYKFLFHIPVILMMSTFIVAQCPDNINNSPGNSGNTINADVFDQNGNFVQTIECTRTGGG